jgi:hypothetical protein
MSASSDSKRNDVCFRSVENSVVIKLVSSCGDTVDVDANSLGSTKTDYRIQGFMKLCFEYLRRLADKKTHEEYKNKSLCLSHMRVAIRDESGDMVNVNPVRVMYFPHASPDKLYAFFRTSCGEYELPKECDVDNTFFELLPDVLACRKCQTTNGKIRACAGCNLVHYCSVPCQRQDWMKHRGMCKAAQS